MGVEDLYYMYRSVFPQLDMEDYRRIYTEYYNLKIKSNMENKNYDLKLAGYMVNPKDTALYQVMSWGVDMNAIKPVEGGLGFHDAGIHTYRNGADHSR